MKLTIKDLNQTHPSYDKAEIQTHQDLYEGGPRFRARIGDYVPQHSVEPHGAYQERCTRTSYENHLGPLIDQWVGEVYRDPPSWSGALSDDLGRFAEDCDRQGTSLAAFWRDRLQEALLHRAAWVLVDLPKVPEGAQVRDRGESRALGLTDPYLVPLHPSQVLDWDTDAEGELEWVIWRGVVSRRSGPGGKRGIVYRWTWYDREQVIQWEAAPDKNGALNETAEPTQVLKQAHTFGRVPMVRLEVKPGLWFGRLLKEPALGLLNAQGALDWSLYKAAFAVLVLQREWPEDNKNLALGPGGFLALEIKDKYGFMEPSGRSWEALANNIKAKLEGLYRVARQIAVSAANDSSRQRASGEAKGQDRKPTEILCGVLGGLLQEAIQASMALACEVSGRPAPEVGVSGLEDYEGADAQTLIDEALALATLRIPSHTFRAKHLGRLVERVLPGLPQEVVKTIHEELQAGISRDLQVEDAYEVSP